MEKPTITISQKDDGSTTIFIDGKVNIITKKEKEQEFFTMPELPNIEIATQNETYLMDWMEGRNCRKGWRLPTQKELMIIYACLSDKDKEKYYLVGGGFWSNTENTEDLSYAWYIALSNGNAFFINKKAKGYIRCVRDKK